MKHTSFRAQILSGAALWTVGLFLAALLLAQILDVRFRRYHLVLYGTVVAHAAILWVVALSLAVAGLVIVKRGLSPLHRLRQDLAAVRSGGEARVRGIYPSEIQPLVDDLNALLAHQDTAVRRAIAKAGDMAHGLKTPLALLTQEAERARAAGHDDLAASLVEQVAGMRRQIEYHLAHARAAASGATPGAMASIAESARGLARTLLRLYAARNLDIGIDVNPAIVVRVQREDLDEMLGNLMDNACKWSRTRVRVTSSLADRGVTVSVEDDGPGVPPSKREAVLRRGVRTDEAAPGSGLGLAIVRDLAELYGGSITLGASEWGGLRANLQLPIARP